jgi:hypothetical protein
MNVEQNRMPVCGLDSSGLGWGPLVGLLEYDNEFSYCIKDV